MIPRDIIPELDVCEWEPWDLAAKPNHPVFSVFQTDEPEWFFFSPLHKKYANGNQFKRETEAGYWKPTGPGRKIKRRSTKDAIGAKKTLVSQRGSGPSSVNTAWIIHEYHAAMPFLPNNKTYVLCRLKTETGCGFPPETNFNGMVPEMPFIQATPLMNMEVDNSSTGTGILQNVPANIMTSGADLSHCASIIASDIRNYEQDDMTPEEYAMLGRSLSSDLGIDSDGYLYEKKRLARDCVLRLKRKKDKKTGSDIPTLDEAVPGGFSPEGTGFHLNGLANNMTLGTEPSHHSGSIASDIRNYQVEEMTSEEHLQLQGLSDDITFPLLDSDEFCDTGQGHEWDHPSPSAFNNSCESWQFLNGVLADSPTFDPNEYCCEGLTGQRSSAAYSKNLNHGSVGRLLPRPQCPLKGVFGKDGGSSGNTSTQVFQVQYSVSEHASSPVHASSKECMQSPAAQRQLVTSGLPSINLPRKESNSFLHDEPRRLDNFVAQQVDPKGVQLAGNASNNAILLAKLTKLSCSMTKPEENSVSIKAKDRAEYGSVTDLPQNKNPIKESKKDCKVTEKQIQS